MMKKEMAYKLMVNYVNLSDDDDDVKFIKKKLPCILEKDLNVLAKNT